MMGQKKLKIKELKGDVMTEKVFYEWKTAMYGRAEFIFEPIWKRGRLTELFIYPAQQPNEKCIYHIKVGWADSLAFGGIVNDQLANPKVWITGWCKEHKTQFMRVYVPENSNYFDIYVGSTLSVNFGYEKK